MCENDFGSYAAQIMKIQLEEAKNDKDMLGFYLIVTLIVFCAYYFEIVFSAILFLAENTPSWKHVSGFLACFFCIK